MCVCVCVSGGGGISKYHGLYYFFSFHGLESLLSVIVRLIVASKGCHSGSCDSSLVRVVGS